MGIRCLITLEIKDCVCSNFAERNSESINFIADPAFPSPCHMTTTKIDYTEK